jgi:excinuclease ABC subunit C
MKSQYLNKLDLPDKPGIYIFRDMKNRPLYIGRATSIRNRVKSYFLPELIHTRGSRIVDMVSKAKNIDFQITDSVLEAVLLEGKLIKKFQPIYNIDEKDDKSGLYIIITKESWPKVFTIRERDLLKGKLKNTKYFKYGPYPSGSLIRESLKILRKIFPFRDMKASDSTYNNFYKEIGRSPKNESEIERLVYLENMKHLRSFLSGSKKTLIRELTKEMNQNAKALRFERAGQIKRTIFALKHINDISLIQYSREIRSDIVSRVEAYDISHLSGSNAIGAFVVFENGVKKPSEYRLFNVSGNDDINNLREVLDRRLNHPEWTYPDLIVVDGGLSHKKAIEAVLSARRINIPVVSVVKDDKHKARAILGLHDSIEIRKTIIEANTEAHRFVIKNQRRGRRLKIKNKRAKMKIKEI